VIDLPEPFLGPKRRYYPDQVTTHRCDDNQNAASMGFPDLGYAFLSIPFLEFEIDGIIENYLFCFRRGDSVLGDVGDVAVVPIEHALLSSAGRLRWWKSDFWLLMWGIFCFLLC
jgi:hypothetical protein